jgi:Arm DNA-binding domain
MRGHVYKRGSSWTVVYDEQPDEHGKRRQRSKGGFATRKEAQRFLNDQLGRLDRGTYSAPSKLTLALFLETEWLRP